MADRRSSRFIPFYHKVLDVLEAGRVPFMVGGAFALSHYAGIERDTKDLDLFLEPEGSKRALELARLAGYRASIEAPHWLAKIYSDGDVVDLLSGSGNGLAVVDHAWFEHSVPARFDGRVANLIPSEEMIWSKGFVMERHRYDGADVAHLIRARGRDFDWGRLLARFGDHWPVLYSHILLFLYIYPHEKDAVPAWVLQELPKRLGAGTDGEDNGRPVCRGTFLSNFEYIPDLQREGLEDPRLKPYGPLSAEELDLWKRHLGL